MSDKYKNNDTEKGKARRPYVLIRHQYSCTEENKGKNKYKEKDNHNLKAKDTSKNTPLHLEFGHINQLQKLAQRKKA